MFTRIGQNCDEKGKSRVKFNCITLRITWSSPDHIPTCQLGVVALHDSVVGLVLGVVFSFLAPGGDMNLVGEGYNINY